MPIADYLASTLKQLDGYLHDLGRALPSPNWVRAGGGMHFRHSQQSDALLIYLKGVKLVSTLNAAVVLLRNGYTQEVGALCRMADDYAYEVVFMFRPADGNAASKDQILMFESFFQEEFENPNNPLESSRGRHTVPRRKVHASFGRMVGETLNPHDAQNALNVLHQTFSGYVHGAYPHIMEMYGGTPPRFHMDGMLNTPRILEWERQLIQYVYRSIMCVEFISRKLNDEKIEKSVRALLGSYEETLDCKVQESAQDIMQREKKK